VGLSESQTNRSTLIILFKNIQFVLQIKLLIRNMHIFQFKMKDLCIIIIVIFVILI